jgi:hypothetical protein
MSPTSPIAEPPTVEWNSGVLGALYELAFAAPDREVAGVLVGLAPHQSPTGMPLVRAAIPVTQGFMPGQASLFVHQTWAQVHRTMGRHYPQLETVGWYVSRPGNGIAFTDADELNHSRWFAQPEQVFLLVDSVGHQAAVYGWRGNRLALLTDGTVARRGTGSQRHGTPAAAIGILIIIGAAVGAVAFILAQALGG